MKARHDMNRMPVDRVTTLKKLQRIHNISLGKRPRFIHTIAKNGQEVFAVLHPTKGWRRA